LSVRITAGSPKILEGAFEDREGHGFLRGGERLAGEQVAAGKIGDGERVAIASIAQHELAFVVGAPEHVGFGGPRQRRAGRPRAPSPASVHQAVAIEHRVHRADRRQEQSRALLA
jgi:hypothetical protein